MDLEVKTNLKDRKPTNQLGFVLKPPLANDIYKLNFLYSVSHRTRTYIPYSLKAILTITIAQA